MKSAIAIIASAALAGFSLASPYPDMGNTDSVSNGAFYRNRVPKTTDNVGGAAAPVADPSNILGVDENNDPTSDCDEVLEDSKNLDTKKNQTSESNSPTQKRPGRNRKDSDVLPKLVPEKPQQKPDSDSTRQRQQGDNRNSVIGQDQNNSGSGPRKGRKISKEDAKKKLEETLGPAWSQPNPDLFIKPGQQPQGPPQQGGQPSGTERGSNKASEELLWSVNNGTFQQKILAKSNEVRRSHGANDLTWDKTLALHARWNVEKCKMKHDNDQWKEGQNLAWRHSNFKCAGAVEDIEPTFKGWIDDEEVEYPRQMTEGTPINSIYLHFTQHVWKSTTKIGCAYACCQGKGHLACNYWTQGNYGGGGTYAKMVQRKSG